MLGIGFEGQDRTSYPGKRLEKNFPARPFQKKAFLSKALLNADPGVGKGQQKTAHKKPPEGVARAVFGERGVLSPRE